MTAQYPNGLAQAMNRAKMDLAWLAKRVGIDVAQLGAWAAGEEPIPPDVAVKLSAKLKTSVADILFGQVQPSRTMRRQARGR